ncbi:MAG: stage 0 sporulation protein [Anaerolineae bacterium]|nr:stage 0 sporulation protein [Anaerolineae bacterium]
MSENIKMIGVRFSRVGKIYHFDSGEIADLREGDMVVVETSRGWQLGEVAQIVKDDRPIPEGGLKKVDRKATPRDLLLRQTWQAKEAEVLKVCQQRVAELDLRGVKIVSAEYSFDGARLTVMFSSDTEEKVELKSLRQDVQKKYSPAQVDIRQIGPRDVAKLLGGMGACGLETRCCSKFLCDFNSISIRMAKDQGVSLTPSEITGMCGRLRCCLLYEYELYTEIKQRMPKRNKIVVTPQGEGKVIDMNFMLETVMVDIPQVGIRIFNREEIKRKDE